LLEWNDIRFARAVGGIFRRVHTIKGMRRRMGYGRVTDLAHRMENLLDHLRRSAKRRRQTRCSLLFRATDALEKAVGLAVAGRERELDVAAILADLDRAGAKEPTAAPVARVYCVCCGCCVCRIRTARASRDSSRSADQRRRATLVMRKVQTLGTVHRLQPSASAFESEDFDGRFAFELDTPAAAREIEAAILSVGMWSA